jgi:hypothetical protein
MQKRRSTLVSCLPVLILLASCLGVIVKKASYDSPSNIWTLNAHQFLYSLHDYDQLSDKEINVSIYPVGLSDQPVYREVLKIRAEQYLGWDATWVSDNEVALSFDDLETGVEPQFGNTYKTKDGRPTSRRFVATYRFVYNRDSKKFESKRDR